jgi:hypothetical protein
MSLINLRTNLKSLRFGNDTQGGGASGLPYIQTGLPEDSPAGEYLAGIARNSADWPLRGGQYWTVASTEDTVRISRFLTDFPKGTTFTTKQVQLQKSNPKIETGGFASRLNTQTYNLNANLLAQVLEQGSGIHIPRAGANTNELGADNLQAKYEYIVSHKNTSQNRLVALYGSKIRSDGSLLSLDSAVTKLGISTDDTLLFDYVGGPDSLYGDGKTTIFKATNFQGAPINTTNAPKGQVRLGETFFIDNLLGFSNNSQVFNNLPTGSYQVENTQYQQGYGFNAAEFIRPEQLPIGMPTINQFGNTMGYSKLLASKGSDLAQTELQDFRSKTIDPTPQAKNYSDPLINIETRLSIGSPGSRKNSQRFNINEINPKGQDKINLLPLYTSTGDPLQNNGVRDIIKFAFEVIDNNNPAQTVPLHFRAYVTNFSDNIGAEWNAQKYMGRGENFYTYQGFTREISFNLKVAAQSKQEMMPLYQKLNYLASSLHPDYSSDGFMRGNLHKLTIGEWLYRTPGVLKSMNISIENDYSWEIKYTEPETRRFTGSDFPKNVDPNSSWKNGTNSSNSPFEDSNSDADMMELPQVLSISFIFSPILNNLPELVKNSDGKFTATPILISDHGNESFVKRVNDSTVTPKPPTDTAQVAISNPNVINTPPVTTATNDVNQQPAATTTSTQAAPAESWIPGSVYISGNVTGPAGTALWEVNRAQQQGFFYWDVTAPNGSVSTGSPSSLVNNVINDAKIEATEAAGL